MNGSPELLERFVEPLAALQSELAPSVRIGLIPPAPLLGRLPEAPGFILAAQDVSEHEDGAFTGETSAGLLGALGCEMALVGHSERRQFFGDDSNRVAAKAKRAIDCGLTPVVCIGETWEQRQSGQTWNCLEQQLNPVMTLLGNSLEKCIVAYEPVWAIGTGKTATPEQAQEVHAWLRQKLDVPGVALLYGGSVKPENANDLFAQADIDGGLIGGASLELNNFEEICRAAARQKQ